MAKFICRCEDLTEEEILALIREGWTTLDEIKRSARTGMGHCQGRTCSRLIAQLVSHETGKPLSEISYPRQRPPIRPVPLRALATGDG